MGAEAGRVISYAEALAIVTGAARPLPLERVPLEAAVGRIAAADVFAEIAHQPFDNSAMDGFALRAAEAQAPLEVIGRIVAGRAEPAAPLGRGQCHEIMTGAPLPEGCDAVVPVESTERLGPQTIRVTSAVRAGDFIRRAGADYRVGDLVLSRGTLLGAEAILALASLGRGTLEVTRAPRVALLSTGAEVRDDLSASLGAGQIYNASRPYLLAKLAARGAALAAVASVGDDARAAGDALTAMAGSADVIVSTGAVSMGAHDFLPELLEDLGAELLFHQVAIRPGKPILMARLSSGALFLGLPGNPASSATGFRFFVQPLLDAMQGRPPEPPRSAVLREAFRKGEVPLRFFLRAHLRITEHGVAEAEIVQRQPSFMVRPFVATQGWVEIPEDVRELGAGALVSFYP